MSNIGNMMHLAIIKGVAKTPQDSTSAEQGLDELDLLDPKGFACDEYLIKIPSMKSSAIYADSPLTNGRTLISGALGNVTETVRLTVNGGTMIQLAALLSKLERMKRDCNDYWDTFGQIDPVYIKHQIDGEPGPRYALLYEIDIDVETPNDPSQPMRTVTLQIEREYGWRGIAPGDNPKRWTIENVFVGQKWTAAKATLTSGSDHLVAQTIQNRREWNAAQTAIISQNHIEISADKIPGDLDALTYIYAEIGNSPVLGVGGIYIARTSKADLLSSLTNAVRPPNYILNASDSTAGTDATTGNADTGAPISTAAAINRRGAVTFVTLTDAQRFAWTPADRGYMDFSITRGRYICLLRARLSAAGTVTMHLSVNIGLTRIDLPTVSLTDAGSGGTGNTTYWPISYMGVLTLPPTEERVFVSDDGLGISVEGATSNPQIALFAARTSGTPVLYVADLILIPIDECAINIKADDADTLSSGFAFIHDNTGYYSHGRPGLMTRRNGSTNGQPNTQPRGQEITLKANETNRLHFFLTDVSASLIYSEIRPTITVKVNIVPRWAGYRTQ